MTTRRRYQAIARLSEQIDKILHCEESVYINAQREGELSVLQSEISKMTVRLREKNRALKREKHLLADALADIAHQLRTPLTSVGLVLSRVETEQDAYARRRLLRETEGLLEQVDWLLTSLLKLSRLDAGMIVFKDEPVRLDALVRKALRPFMVMLELRGISVSVDVPADLVINGDFNWLCEAIGNIIKNSVQSIGKNGSITICARRTPMACELCIHDSGKGFKDNETERIFERFYRSDTDSASGYGIGLALCRMIVTGHHASIEAKNHPEGGALFIVRFPR